MAVRRIAIYCSPEEKKQNGLIPNRAGLVAHFQKNTPSLQGGVMPGVRLHLTYVATGSGRARLSATPGCHAGCPAGRPFPSVERTRDRARRRARLDMVGRRLPPPLRGTPPAARGVGRAAPLRRVREWRPRPRGGRGRRRLGARPASLPPAVGDGVKATVHHPLKILAGEGEEIKGSSSTDLIEEWVGLVHAVARGPSATSMAKTEQSSAIPQLKEKRAPGG